MYLIVFGVIWSVLTVLLLSYALYHKYRPESGMVILSGQIAQALFNISMMVWVGITISFIFYFAATVFGDDLRYLPFWGMRDLIAL